MKKLNLSDRFLQVHSQRGLLTCVPIAFCDAIWWEIHQGNAPGVRSGFLPSVQFVYYNARKLEGIQNSNAPVAPSRVMEALTKFGVCSTELWPDETRLYRNRPSTEAYEKALPLKDWRFEEVPQTQKAIWECLENQTPFFFCLRFCRSNSWSFEGGKTSQTGILTTPAPDETPFRNHAMLAVGMDKHTGVVHARNSYGSDWGNQGHALIPLEYILNKTLSYGFWKVIPPIKE